MVAVDPLPDPVPAPFVDGPVLVSEVEPLVELQRLVPMLDVVPVDVELLVDPEVVPVEPPGLHRT